MDIQKTNYVTNSLVTLLILAGFTFFSTTEQRINITGISPAINTGQDYSPWMNDDINSLVQNVWTPSNQQYTDITLRLEKKSKLIRISLYDFEGIFTDKPASFYALNGTQKTFLGNFTGDQYKVWVDLQIGNSIVADAVIIHKYGNNIPQKIKIFGEPYTDGASPPNKSVITFPDLPVRTLGNEPFMLTATSNNPTSPIIFSSSDTNIVSVYNEASQWKARIKTAGSVNIIASQQGNDSYSAADNVLRTQVILPPTPVIAGKPIPGKIEAENYDAMNGIATENTGDEGGGSNVGWIDEKDWLDYNVQVTATGNYSFSFRVASTSASGELQLQSQDGTILSDVQIPNTGGWQNWITINTSLSLNQGAQKLRIYAKKSGWNINWFQASTQVITTPLTSGKIPIDPKRWYQLNNTSNGLNALFDGKTSEDVFTGWGHILYNFDAYYPLLDGEEMNITSIRLFDGQGNNLNDPVRLSVITTDWKVVTIATFTGGQYMKWVGPYAWKQTGTDNDFKLDSTITNARYIVLNTSVAYPTEIEFYGSYTAPPPVTPAIKKPVTLNQMLGVNAFEWDFEEPGNPSVVNEAKLQAIKTFTGVRHYMDWEKLELEQGSYTFNPTYSGGWNYDAIYEKCKAEGIEVLACLKTIPGWMQSTYPSDQRDMENVPVKWGKDLSDPSSYIEQAKVAFQYAARYGYNPSVDRSLLSVNAKPRWGGDPINTIKTGLGLIKYIECDNERDKWWKGRKAYQTGREYAANLSAFYDGHKNTMGPGVGIKNADPAMKVVMAGLANPSTDYVRGMIDWCKQFRGYKADGSVNLCWDIINYHFYSNDSKSSQSGNATRGTAPEVSGASQVAADFIQVAHQYANDMPVWVTECGYDVNQGSPFKAIAIQQKPVLETQADWILRTSLLYARAGVERVFFYQLYDDNINSSTQFASSGLINANKTRKPAADYIYQVKKLFGGYAYKETINADPVVDRYELNGQSVYMLVIPDEKGRKGDYNLDLGNADSAYLYNPVVASGDMNVKRSKTTAGKMTVTVTETPVFVVPSGTNSNNRVSAAQANTARMDDSTEVLKTAATISTSERKDLIPDNSVKVYPNPASQYVMISIQNDKRNPLEIRIIEEGSGRIVRTYILNKNADTISKKIDMVSLKAGYYMIEVIQGNSRITRKVLKANP